MKIDIIVPASGESVKEADIAKWYKASGETVKMDEPLLSLETEKAALEVAAECDGVLTILAPEGKTVKVGQVVGYISPSAVADTMPPVAATPAPAPKSPVAPAIPQPTADLSTNKQNAVATATDRHIPSPSARKLMAENAVAAPEIHGTGKDGRITKADVLAVMDQMRPHEAMAPTLQEIADAYSSLPSMISPDETITLMRRPRRVSGQEEGSLPSEVSALRKEKPTSAPIAIAVKSSAPADASTALRRDTRREKMSRLRKTIAQRLVDAQQTTALVTTFNEVDMSAIVELRNKYREQYKAAHNVSLGFVSFFTTAVCHALKQFPIVNARIEGEEIVYSDFCDIGIAVATPRGLVVPVIRNAERQDLVEIEKSISALATKGRNGELTVDDLAGGTFSITNGGVFGSMLSTPIVNHPQSAILGMHNIVDRPVVRAGQIVIRPIMYVALTYDHRIIDGADAVRFLVKVKEQCEEPMRLMLAV